MRYSTTIFSLLIMCSFLRPVVHAQSHKIFTIDKAFVSANTGQFCYHLQGSANPIYTQVPDTLWKPFNAATKWMSPYTEHWIRISLSNTGEDDRTLKFFINNVQAGNTKMYVMANGKIDSSRQTGSLMPASRRANSDRFLSIPFTQKAGAITTLYVKSYRRQNGITFTPFIEDPATSYSHSGLNNFMLFALSLLLFISIISLHMFIAFPSKEGGWFAVYTAATFFYILSASGYGALYLWGNFPLFEENAAVFLGAVGALSIFQLCRFVFDMKKNYRRLNIFLQVFSIVNILISLLGFGLVINHFSQSTYTNALSFIYLLQVIGNIWVWGVSINEAVKKGRKEFWWFVTVFSIIILLTFMLIFQEVGLIQFDYRFHAIMLAAGLIPQTIIPLIFFINRNVRVMEKRREEIISAKLLGEKKLLNERLRMGQQLHDDIGSTLSGINMYSYMALQQCNTGNQPEVSKSLIIIQESAVEMINKLKEIVWTVQPGKDNISSLTDKIEEYATYMANAKDMKVKTVFESAVTGNASISSEKRQHLFLIAKETINNAVKYSGASTIFISTRNINKLFHLIIKDDGKGFDISNANNGNGIGNIRSRVDAIGGELLLKSSVQHGTLMEVKVKITS